MDEQTDLPEVAPHDEPIRLIEHRQDVAQRLDDVLDNAGTKLTHDRVALAANLARLVDHLDGRLDLALQSELDEQLAATQARLAQLDDAARQVVEAIESEGITADFLTGRLAPLAGPLARLEAIING